jgi:hypothetical protein
VFRSTEIFPKLKTDSYYYNHFYLEYFLNVPMPEGGERQTFTMRFHDGAMITERWIEYFFPYPSELKLIR